MVCNQNMISCIVKSEYDRSRDRRGQLAFDHDFGPQGVLWLSSYPLKLSQIFENSMMVRFSKDISMDFMAVRRPDRIDPDLSGMDGATAASTPAWPNRIYPNYS
jgi:hypothetical protein